MKATDSIKRYELGNFIMKRNWFSELILVNLFFAGAFGLCHFTDFLLERSYMISFFITSLSVSFLLFLQRNKTKSSQLLFEKLESFRNDVMGTNAQFKETCTQLEDGIVSQASAIVETSSSSDEISSMISRTSEGISQVGSAMNEISSYIVASEQSSRELEDTLKVSLDSNQEVMETMNDISKSLGELTHMFQEVSEKTKIINDIVFQTKLLSFNASVEAARAGEHGKGFAVVAEEIGSLAITSGESANAINKTLNETADRIENMRKDISHKNKLIEEKVIKASEESRLKFDEFKGHFNHSSQKTLKVNEEIEEISFAAVEQDKGVDELRDAINLIHSTVQRNTLVVSQTLNLSHMLSSYIDYFDNVLKEGKKEHGIEDTLRFERIQWDDKYRIGVNDMDEEHIVLLDRINSLIDDMNQGTLVKIKSSFVALEEYTIEHFTHEESYMRSIEYPAYESHKKVHENLLMALSKFKEDIEKNQLDGIKLSSFLKNWLFTHIMGVDTKYAKHSEEFSHAHSHHSNSSQVA